MSLIILIDYQHSDRRFKKYPSSSQQHLFMLMLLKSAGLLSYMHINHVSIDLKILKHNFYFLDDYQWIKTKK